MMKRFFLSLWIVVSVATGLSANAVAQISAADVKPTMLDPVANKRVAEISSQLRCLVCQNQSIADSNAELAMDLKNQVMRQVADGRSNEQIIDYMVERYGDFVLYDPPVKLSTALLWIGPGALFIISLFTLFWTLYKRQKEVASERPLTEEEKKRAQALLAGETGQSKRKG